MVLMRNQWGVHPIGATGEGEHVLTSTALQI
jgi:hypothetical protein